MRIQKSFNADWKFRRLPSNGVGNSWENVTLPHTWNSIDGCDGQKDVGEYAEGYYRGVGEYRRAYVFDSNIFSDREIFIEFNGANQVTEFLINDIYAGCHKGGYSRFRFDITDLIKLDNENAITVKVDNSPTDYIAPIREQGDFTKMGGIYRNVNLIAVNKIHIDMTDHGSSGVYVTPKNISEESADIDVLVKLANDGNTNEKIIVRAEINGEISEKEVIIAANRRSETLLKLKEYKPVLWHGVKNPRLYKARITLLKDGMLLDEYIQSFGIRTYSIDFEKGFFLNGEYTDLRGVNYHQDSYENGWAMTNEQRERDYGIMREMGCTAVRMAHYQHDGYEYDLCDRFGFAVWTEIGIVNKMSADDGKEHRLSDGFADNAKSQLTELILQNYNHPSIIVWGISNELHQMTDEIFGLYKELSALAKSLDNTRLITYADNQGCGRFLKLPTDTVGYNRYFGWYQSEDGKGSAEELGGWLDLYHTEKTALPLCLSEFGGGGAVSQHKDNIDWQTDIVPWGTPHYENYQSELHEKLWAQLAGRKYVWGKFIWCMFDFASDGRNEGDTHGQNDKGLCTRERIAKDAFYFYKSVWNDEPMVHITEKRFTERPADIPAIKVYSNAESVELFVNGVSMGVIKSASLDPRYPTVYIWENISVNKGIENEIKVTAAFPDGTVIKDNAMWFGKG